MGNICRSPTAEGVMRRNATQRGLGDTIMIASAGTHAYHVGQPPDNRSQAHALQRGVDMSAQRARRIDRADFETFDFLLAMDEDNLALLLRQCPPGHQPKVGLLMRYARKYTGQPVVPDPYYGGVAGFEAVLDYIEDACDGLLDAICMQINRAHEPARMV